MEKDEAKALGCKWDAINKTWFLMAIEDITPYAKWFSTEQAKPNTERATPKKITHKTVKNKLEKNSMNTVIIYTDGACKVKSGRGGWGALLSHNNKVDEIYGGEIDTTNNRMELMGAIMALETLTKASKVLLHSDSQYVIKGISEWLPGWKKRGWKTATKDPVKNEDLWRRLDAASNLHKIEWKWVKGHTGNEGNERADALANLGIDNLTSNI